MPDALGVPPGVPPEDYASFINAQRQQMLANALMQGSLTPIQQPETQPVKGIYVQPRVGAVQGAAKIAQALLGNRAMKQAIQSEIGLQGALNQAYAPGGKQIDPGTAPQPGPDASVPQMLRDPNQSYQDTTPGRPPTYAPVNPRNPQGLPADVVRNLAMTDPAKYAAMLQGPESVQLGRIAGIDPAATARAALAKQTQTEIRPGATVVDPISGRTMMGADPSKGEYYAIGPNGQVAAFPITNDATLQAWRAGLTKGAQEANTPHYEPDPFHPGQMHVVYPPTPPALAGAGPPGPPSPVAGAPPPQSTPSAPGAAPAAGPAPGGAPPPPRPPAAPAPPATRAPNTAADLEQQKKGVESGQSYSDQLLKNAENATEVRRSLAELRNLSNAGGVNVANPAKLELGSYMIAAGMDPKTVGSMLGTDIDALTAASKQTGSLALDSIHSMTSRGTNFDLSTFMRYNPNLNMGTPGGFNRVLDFMDQRMQQEVGKQADFAQWSQSQPPNRWAIDHPARWLAKQNQLIGAGKTNSRPPLSSFVTP